jgi:hypothetical protein
MHLCFCKSPFLELNFCYPSLSLVVAISQVKLNPSPQLLGVSYTLSHSAVLLPHSLNLRDTVSSQKAVTCSIWEVISLSCLLRQAWIWTWVLTSPTSCASHPLLVPASHWAPLCIQGLHSDLWERWLPLPDQAIHWCLVGSYPGSPGDIPQWQGSWQISISTILARIPKKCCRNLKLRYGTLRQFSRKQHFIVPAQIQQTHVQRLSPKNKKGTPYIPLQAGYRSKKQNSTHIWLHVTSLAVSFLHCYVTFFMFPIFKFSHCFSIPSPCFIIRSQPVCFSSGLPLCYSRALHSKHEVLSSNPYTVKKSVHVYFITHIHIT